MTDQTGRSRLSRLRIAPHTVVIAGIVVVMLITFAVIIASLDRGFDWSDEGFVYVMIASNRVSTSEFWGFQYLLHPIYDLFGGSVLAFRILRLLGYIALGIILTLVARQLIRSMGLTLRRSSWILVGLVAQVGTFAAWSYPPRYLGYNELSSWFTQLGAALVIFLLLEGRGQSADSGARGTARRWPLWLVLGVLLSVLILVKITAGVLLVVVAVAASLLTVAGGPAWKRVAGLAGGIAAGFLLMLVSGVPLLSFLSTTAQLGADPSAQAESGYSVTGLLRTYLASMAETVGALALPIVLTAILVLVIRGFREDRSAAPSRVVSSAENVSLFLAFALAVVLVAINVFPGTLDSWASLGVSNAFLLVLAIVVFAVLVTPAAPTQVPAPSRARSIAVLAFAFGLFAIAPLISAVGTNNRIFGHTVFSATLWAVGAAVALVILWERSTAVSAAVRLLPVLLLGVVVASSGLAVAGDVFVHPYRTTAYFTQKTTIEVADLRGIRVTDDEAEVYQWLHDAGERQDAQDVPAVSIATPGALLAFNASGWTAVWPGRSWASSIARSCEPEAPDDLIVLQSEDQIPGSVAYDRLVAGLDACGISFPDDFDEVDRHPSSVPLRDITVWRLG